MKKDILLAVISEAIDKGASISVHFGQYHKPDFTPVTKEEAFTLAQLVSDAIGIEVEESDDSDGGPKNVHTFAVYGLCTDANFSLSASYIKHMEEDVQLDGSDFDDREVI